MADPTETVLVLDSELYRISAIKKALYKLDRLCTGAIRNSNKKIEVTLSPRSKSAEMTEIVAAFHSELLDQDLREIVADETRDVRNLILAHALSGLCLVDQDLETADHREDPAQIGDGG